ncbi:hypothetical protein C5Y96_26965 [Blastopirellula marina]|uniref:Uncharacterized protein n=1 Tax=Blastopirellula marina TaxID=124 RepID=A0A2S8EZ07_9BACT|nr:MULTISPECIES: hypothetical protein [Pirellulaceae]PQO25143.1 hypothetical protein C5Y96_26965 [Blastopirellula marina]RCS40994.1 hypothetical protein DTL36_27010 [Bremerella cremea]
MRRIWLLGRCLLRLFGQLPSQLVKLLLLLLKDLVLLVADIDQALKERRFPLRTSRRRAIGMGVRVVRHSNAAPKKRNTVITRTERDVFVLNNS